MKVNFTRPLHIVEKIIFLDGMNGTGKSILGPILSSFSRVEKQSLNHTFEHICLTHHFGKMTTDAASSFLNIYADLALYNSMISREVNLRPGDDSGAINNPNSLRYLSRLFVQDGDEVLRRIDKERPILQIMTHQMLPIAGAALEAFGNRACFIEMVRHPVYMLEHWMSYITRYGTDRREFNFWIEHEGTPLPWFAAGWEDKFVQSAPMDRVIFGIDHLMRQTFEFFDVRGPDNILMIPFEKIVLTPEPVIAELEAFLGTTRTKSTAAALARQKCPRARISEGKGHKHYGWKPEKNHMSEIEVFRKKRKFAEENASSEALAVLDALSDTYEQRFGVGIF